MLLQRSIRQSLPPQATKHIHTQHHMRTRKHLPWSFLKELQDYQRKPPKMYVQHAFINYIYFIYFIYKKTTNTLKYIAMHSSVLFAFCILYKTVHNLSWFKRIFWLCHIHFHSVPYIFIFRRNCPWTLIFSRASNMQHDTLQYWAVTAVTAPTEQHNHDMIGSAAALCFAVLVY